MQYKFNEFEFDSDSLVLSQSGKSIDIRHNEAKLLAFLIENSDQVVSKEHILSHIWRDKVVSEQAIFQNISHLRAIFGNDAIKTFPKRGYQWQLPLAQSLPITTTVKHPTDLNKVSATPFKLMWLLALVVLIGIVTGVSVRLNGQTSSAEKAFSIAVYDEAERSLHLSSKQGLVINTIAGVSSQSFLQSPEYEYAVLKPSHSVVLGGQLRQFNNTYYYEFLLKGQAGEWQGVYAAQSTEQIQQDLLRHLSLDAVQNIVSNAMLPDIKVAQLAIAQDKNPDDLILLSQLVDAYISINQFENALVMAEKLEQVAGKEQNSVPNNHFYLATALLKQGKILKRKELYPSSAAKLAQAITYFDYINDNKGLSDAWYENAQLRHWAGDYNGVKSSLLKASKLAAEANDRIREIESLTYLSVLAYKNRQVQDQYHYLLLAEKRMKDYQLPNYHFAKIPFHYAIFAEYEADKVPHYKQVLEYCQLNPDFWVAQTSRKNLLKYYLKHNRIDEAKELVADLQSDNAQNGYLHTLIALAENKQNEFIGLAQSAFEKAQLAGLYDLSADIAMLLLTEVNELDSRAFYLQFIEKNASKHWRNRHKAQLMAWSV